MSFRAFTAFALVALAVPAQQIVHRSSAAGVPLVETDAQTFMTPMPDPFPNAATIPAPFLAATPFPLGDLTMNNATGVLYATNGPLIAQYNDARYAPLAPIFPPLPGPPIGMLTGLAIDSAAGVLFCTSGAVLCATPAVPPYLLLGPPVPFAFPIVAPPMTGLDWDPLTGSLWGNDAGGFVYNFTPLGLPIGPQPVLLSPAIFTTPATDIVVHRHLGNLPGVYVQYVGFGVLNYLTGAFQASGPIGIPPGTEAGLAIHNHPAILPGACACPAPVYGPMGVGVTGPCSIGNLGFGFTLTGSTPFTPVLFGLDGVAFPTPLLGGCTFWLPLPPALLVGVVTDALGNATFAAPLPALPFLIGVTGYTQWASPCPAAPFGVVLSDAQQFIISAP